MWGVPVRTTPAQHPGVRITPARHTENGHQRDTGPWWPEMTERDMVSCLGHAMFRPSPVSVSSTDTSPHIPHARLHAAAPRAPRRAALGPAAAAHRLLADQSPTAAAFTPAAAQMLGTAATLYPYLTTVWFPPVAINSCSHRKATEFVFPKSSFFY